MAFSDGQGDQQVQGRLKPPFKRKFKPKAKTGCHTCRIRRVKCDEARPACQRCLSTDRVCDGYPSVFRVVTLETSPPSTSALRSAANTEPSLSLYRPKSSIITVDEVNKLAHYFHRRRRGTVNYQNEARAVLTNLSDPAIRHALNSLSQLHHGPGETRYMALDAYNTAVSSLAARLSQEPSRASAQAALVCCQMFISIEVILCDYKTAFQHLLQGLRIMRQYRNRPAVSETGSVVPCTNPDFPHLDAFAIKLFASGYPGPRHMSSVPLCESGLIGPMMAAADALFLDQARNDLSALSVQVLEFLSRVTALRSHSQVTEMRMMKAQMLGYLESWEQTYSETIQEMMGQVFMIKVQFATAFSLLLHRVLKVAVSLAMSVSPVSMEELERDFDALAEISTFATETRMAGMNGETLKLSS